MQDILAVLDQYKPDPSVVGKARAAASLSAPVTPSKGELADFYLRRARAASQVGRISQQIEDLRLALEAAPADHVNRHRIMDELAVAESQGGNWLNSMRLRASIPVNASNPGREMSQHASLAGYYSGLGNLGAAREHMKKADGIFRYITARGINRWFVDNQTFVLENNRGHLYAAEGKLTAAEAAFRKSIVALEKDIPLNRIRLRRPDFEGLTPPQDFLESHLERQGRFLASNLISQGRLIDAELAARGALQQSLSRAGRYSVSTGASLGVLSRAIFEQGRFAEAGLLAVAAIDSLDKAGVTSEALPIAQARSAHAATLVAQQRWKEALAEYQKMRAGLEKDPRIAERFHRGDVNWSLALIKEGQADAAAAMLAGMLERTERRLGDAAYPVAELRGFHAAALAAKGDRHGALAEFRRAVPVLLEQARLDQGSESAGVARSLRLNHILEAYIALLSEIRAPEETPGFDPVSEAFRVADVARGSGVQRALAASAARADLRDARLAELARREQDARRRIGSLTDILTRLLASPPEQQLPKIIGELKRDIAELQRQRIRLRRQIQERSPEYSSLVDPRPLTIREAQALLKPGEAVVAVHVSGSASYVWAFSASGTPAFAASQLGLADISAAVSSLRKALDVGGGVSLQDFPVFDVALAYRLYRELLLPVAAGWENASSLLIVAHGPLGQLPFSVLATENAPAPIPAAVLFEGYKPVPWLIRKAAITHLPSVSTLLLRKSTAGNPNRRAFVGFGDPIFDKGQMDVPAGGTQLRVADAASVALRNLAVDRLNPETFRQMHGARPADSQGLRQLSRLPDTAEEIREIAATLRADPASDVFLGVDASEQRIKTMDLSNRRVVAFATHGLVPGDLDGLTQPALALSSPEVTGEKDGDGLLTLDEIMGLKLDADWVVLSACNTAAGDGAGSEAVSGLGRAFFYAGARALLVSNWPVETNSARLLTTDLFRRQTQNPRLSRAEALRQTMLALIADPGFRDDAGRNLFSYAHPMFWAPFSLIGDGARN